MAYLLDSDDVIDYFANAPGMVATVERCAQDGIAFSIISYMEVYEGVVRGIVGSAELTRFVDRSPILPLTIEVVQRCASLREELRTRGRRIRSRQLDLLIAATALEHGVILITRNTADYADIPGLALHKDPQ